MGVLGLQTLCSELGIADLLGNCTKKSLVFCGGDGKLAPAADESAANEPGQSFGEEIPGKVLDFFGGPAAHGSVADERSALGFIKLEARRAVREPTDVAGGPAQGTIGVADLRAVQRAADGLDECKDETFGRGGLQMSEAARPGEKANEKTERAFAGARLEREGKTAETVRVFGFGAEAAQVRLGQWTDPIE